MRNPSVHFLPGLGGNRRPGLAQAALDPDLSLPDVLLTSAEFNLAALPTGPVAENPY